MGHRKLFLLLSLSFFLYTCKHSGKRYTVNIKPNLEDRLDDGSPYTPGTQSFLRGHHWLETVSGIEIIPEKHGIATVVFLNTDDSKTLKIRNIDLTQLVPRLNYSTVAPPDDFDAFNLMLAEYSRNSLSVPVGKKKDVMAHFDTNLEEVVPWELTGEYQFRPNKYVRPVRVGLVNNCLASGLWEVFASDRSGEIYHGWYDMPPELYYRLVGKVNGFSAAEAVKALEWKTDPVKIDLERLRKIEKTYGKVPTALKLEGQSGFSTQDSRRKLRKGYALVKDNDNWKIPEELSELTSKTCRLSSFIEPGKYSVKERKEFDLSFLAGPAETEVYRAQPFTNYNWRASSEIKDENYLELKIKINDYYLIIGNLPMFLLVPQADYAIHGFGVGILSSSGLAERRKYLIQEGAAPSFAYLCKEGSDGSLLGLNSHEFGIEQIFIRTHSNDENPWWEVTVTSYERIIDIVKYRIDIPRQLHDELRQCALEYIAPLYLTYRDDNLR